MVDKLGGVSSASFRNPRNVINVQAVIDRTIRDLLGLEPNITEEKLRIADEKFLRLVYRSSENPVELAEKLQEASGNLSELFDNPSFVPSALQVDEIVAGVEKIFKTGLGLPGEATRDEIKQATAPYLKEILPYIS